MFVMVLECFLVIYLDGFVVLCFFKDEWDVNVWVYQFCVQLLGEMVIFEFIVECCYQDVCDWVCYVELLMNLLIKSEKIVFYSVFDILVNQKIFLIGLVDFFYGMDMEEEWFKGFLCVFGLLGINCWFYVMLFGFICFLQEKVYVKFILIQNVVKVLCW